MVSSPVEGPLKPVSNAARKGRKAETIPTFRKPWWERQPDLAAFVRASFGTMRIIDIPGACRERFPDIPVPTRGGICHFLDHLRGGSYRKRPRQRTRPRAHFGPESATSAEPPKTG
jgi:hypothetical protein